MKCACCGGEMAVESETGKSMLFKCKECGLSDTKLKMQ